MNIDPGNYAELKSMIDAICDGTITDDQVSRLEKIIAADETALEFYIQYMWLVNDVERMSTTYSSKIDLSQFDGLLPDSEQPSKQLNRTIEDDEMVTAAATQQSWGSTQHTDHRTPTRNWNSMKTFAAFAALAGSLLIGLTVAYLAFFSENDPSRLSVAQRISAETLERKQLADGTIVIAQAGTQYKIENRRQILLEKGELYLIVSKSNEPFIVNTAEGEVRATGTRFTVSATDKTETAVAQGKVTLSSNMGNIQLGAGQQGTLTKDSKPTRAPARRLSYLINWAKDALKQDELLVPIGDRENGLLAIDPYGQEARLTLRKYNVDVYIEDGIARTTIDQTFFNHNPWNTEGTFYFPLPPDASVSRLAMYVNGELNEGGMVSRERGQEIYTEILYQRRDPALLEMMEGNMFKMRIFPLEGRQEKRIFLSYTQNLNELYGTSKYWFPMDHTQDITNELSIRVRIKDGAKRFEPKSSTHDLKASIDGDDLVMEYAAKKIKPDQDFLLNLIPQAPVTERADETRVAICELNGQRYVSAKLRPNLDGEHSPEPRQWIVLNDISASRSKLDLDTQHYILKRLITEADDDDSVFLIDLNTSAQNISSAPINVRSAVVKAIIDHRPQRLIGATNLEAGLKAVGETIKNHEMSNPHLVYLGDGVATDGEKKISELPRLIPPSCKFVGVGIGKKVDSMFLQQAANRTGGAFTTINPNEDIDWRVFDLLALLNTPRLTNIQVDLLDENERSMECIAYPSSRLLSAGETLTVTAMCGEKLPSQIRFQGRIGGKLFTKTANVESAKKGANYLPRLWAKRHIDELLKSNMSSKEEIVALSKDFYVVTPFTSLIVLEDDAMYEEYGVERGRKDHWAKYDAPKKIDVVREPVDWNRWGWGGWQNFQSEESQIEVTSRPQTVQEIVDNIQIRVNAPFYLWQEPARDSRTELYRLCEPQLKSASDPARWLTLWYLMAANEQETVADWQRGGASETSPNLNPDRSDLKKLAGLRQWRQSLYYRSMGGMGLGDSPAANPLFGGGGGFGSGGGMGGGGFGGGRGGFGWGGFGGGRLGVTWAPGLGGQLTRDGRFLPITDSRRNLSPRYKYLGTMNPRYSLMISELEMPLRNQLQSPTGLLGGDLFVSGIDGLNPTLAQTLNRAISQRQRRLTRDIQKFNQQNGYGWQNQSYGWNEIDLRKTITGSFSRNGLNDLLSTTLADFQVDDVEADIELDARAFAIDSLFGRYRPPIDGKFDVGKELSRGLWFDRPIMQPEILGLVPTDKRVQGSTFFALSQQPINTQPGMASVLAADHLHPRLTELENSDLDKRTSAEKKAIEVALSNMDRVGAQLEPNGLFWGYAGWQYQPRPETIEPPTIQAYQGYRWSFDLTRYANGLYSDTLDMLEEVSRQYGSRKPAGTIDNQTRELIEASRGNLKPVVVSYGDDGPEFRIGPNDQYATTSRSEMYLTEEMICDGKNIFQVYDELGIAARRDASETRLSMLRAWAPHVLESVDALIQDFDVELVETDEQSFTLKLTLAQPESSPSDSTDPEAKSEMIEYDLHLLIHVDHQGRVLKKQLIQSDVPQLTISFDFQEDEVKMTWDLNSKSEKAKGLDTYFAKPFSPATDTFSVDLEPLVVIDMPLKKPSFYIQKLQELSNHQRTVNGEKVPASADENPNLATMKFLDEDCSEAIKLNRHLALAQIQDFNLSGWGVHVDVLNNSLARTIALGRQIGKQCQKGDLTLLGSLGGNPRSIADVPKELFGTPLDDFFSLRLDWSESEKRFQNEKGLIGHLGAFRVASMNQRPESYRVFRKRFEDSPLTLALLHNHPDQFKLREMIKLNQDPRWSGVALLVAAVHCSTDIDKKQLAEAFWIWEQDLMKAKMIPVVSNTLINVVKSVDRKRLSERLAKQLKVVQELNSTAALLTFAEQLSAWGETELADTAYADARERLKLDDETVQAPLLKRFAFAQSLWAGNRYQRAYLEYQAILATLKSKQISASPALLAATARLANQAGHTEQAIEFEEQALAMEQPYLPDAINLNAFRQRYQWLWSRYVERVQVVGQNDPDRQSKTDDLISRATATWDRWQEVDRDNGSLAGQMATLLQLAGREDQSWEFLSSVIDQKPQDASSYFVVGDWFRQQGNKAAAARWLGEAPQWDTANPQWLFQYGKALKELGRKTEANVQFNKVINGKWAPGLQRWIDQAKAEVQ